MTLMVSGRPPAMRPVRFHSQSFQKDPSMTRTIRNTYEKKVSKLFVTFRYKATKMLMERTFGSSEYTITRVNFPNLTNGLLYLIASEITAPGEALASAMVNESLKAGKLRAGAFLRSVGIIASISDINVDPRVYEIIKERNIAALNGITDDMAKTIKAELSEGILKGEDMRRLSKRVSEATGVPMQRARVMARTETMFAFNHAKDEEFRKYGVKKVEWVAALDERMCPKCGSFHGKVYPIDEAPDCPNHPNCLIDGQYPVLTSKGWKPISKISIGELVLTHKGRFRPVTQTFKIPRQKTDITRIKVRSGTGQPNILSLTPDHPVLIGDSWIAAKDVKPGDNISFLAGECARCGRPVEFYKKYCSVRCNSLDITDRQWSDPEHRANISAKASAQMRREYAAGIRNGQTITAKAHEKTREMVADGTHPLMNPEVHAKAARSLGSKNYGKTWIEEKFGWALSQSGIEAEPQFRVPAPNDSRGRPHYYFLDFAIPEHKIAIECDGHIWHDEERDRVRQNYIESQGWMFLRYSDDEIKNDLFGCVNEVSRVLANHEGDYHFLDAPVVAVETFTPRRLKTLWNLSVLEDESFVAKGFVVHNCRCTTIPRIDEVK